MRGPAMIAALADIVNSHEKALNGIHCSLVLAALARSSSSSGTGRKAHHLREAAAVVLPVAERQLLRQILLLLQENLILVADARTVASCTWALARLSSESATSDDGRGDSDSVGSLSDHRVKIDDSDSSSLHQEMAFTVKSLVSRAATVLLSFNSQDISLTLWGLATLRYDAGHCHIQGSQFLEQASALASGLAMSASSQSLSNSLWSFATLGFRPEWKEVERLLDAAVLKVRSFEAQHLSNSLWALAKLQHRTATNFPLLASREMESRIDTFNAQNVSNAVTAMTQLGFRPPESTLAAAAWCLRSNVQNYTPQNLSSLLHALAKQSFHLDETTMLCAQAAVSRSASAFSARDVTTTCWAFTVMQDEGAAGDLDFSSRSRSRSRCLRALEGAALNHMAAFDAQELSTVLWALAQLLVHVDERLLEQARWAVLQKVTDFSPQDLAMTTLAASLLASRFTLLASPPLPPPQPTDR